ncbi:hypothetical protein E2C01_002032 [Portunus trituberculatus]|uniref:Uncharacterized protein n=1 Tax=Portunus trituberculatus TaxID=210409 RepID=A0A5B7CJB4_PORTR|nr:hypothetical protein [Portunus trituberculatus]
MNTSHTRNTMVPSTTHSPHQHHFVVGLGELTHLRPTPAGCGVVCSLNDLRSPFYKHSAKCQSDIA